LLQPLPPFSLYNDRWPVFSHQLPLPPAKLAQGGDGRGAQVGNSLLCAGTIVSGGLVDTSILGPGVYVDTGAEITDSILFPGVKIGAGARIHRCVIDKNVSVPAGFEIGIDPVVDAAQYTVSQRGVVVIEKDRTLRGA
jgi:glucose-1-phosphate adenylyltransferase